jgi:hypothetical protein
MGGEKGVKNYRRVGQVSVSELGLRRFSVNGGDGMGRREVGGQGEFVDFKQLRQGDLIAAGVWVGTRKGKFGPVFEIFDEEKEETILVPGSGQLKYKMKEYCKLGNFVEIEYDGNIRELFRTHREFIDDLERWWNNFSGLSVFKRVIGCPIIGTSRRSFGYDMRESLVKYTYTKRYQELKKKLLEEG